ncbi:protein mono-ADP-ribosyltransferase PARP14-like [Gracilinanus agilis]|uniref:protein mono-ADP-ribosyltransferase PARP14-like n=1 Tax=Gracilinanus agilis TaxID=191870 RepID=UPI001CFF2225|nr:protein mono-ADP-ribosyltransferase PARP14-like [Gracilinanus agilis]
MATGGSGHGPPWRVLVQVAKNRSGIEKKLQKYLQSRKRAGGGECTVKAGPSEGTYWVEFLESQARQRVLEKKSHELELPGEEKLTLTVTLPTAKHEDEDNEEPVPKEESKIKDGTQEQDASEDQDTKHPLDGILGEAEDMSKESGNEPYMFAFKNAQDFDEFLLILLVENISGLSKNEGDFEIEILPEVESVVLTFLKPIDTRRFIDRCFQNRIVQERKIFVAPLEVTRTILVENLPQDVDENYITLFFENPQNGGGPIKKVQCLPKVNSALIEFSECKVVKTILTKKLLFNNSPLSMFPYYHSLDTALYGKAKPPAELPEPFKVPIEPYLLKFFHQDDGVIKDITRAMETFHCELTWPQLNCKEPEIILGPSATLVSQRRTKNSIIKTWIKDVSLKFSSLMSEYQVKKYNMDPMVWEAVRDSIGNERALIEFDKLQETVIIAGRLEDVQKTEPEVKTQIERATQKIEREKQSIRSDFTLCPGRFSILRNNGLEETLHKEYPELEVTYNSLTKSICLSGLQADVYKAKSEILEKLQGLAQKSLHIAPQIVQFLQQVDCETFSEDLFVSKKISATYLMEGTAIFLFGSSPQVLSEAEQHMQKALDFKCIDVVDSEILNDHQWKTLTDNLDKKYNCSSKTIIIEEQNSDTGVKIMIAGCVGPVYESYQEVSGFIEENTKIQESVPVKSLAIIQYIQEENEQILENIKKKKVKIDFKTLANERGISLSGPKGEVMKGVTMVKQILESIHVENFSIHKPGADILFKDKEGYYKMEAKKMFNCLIRLQEDGDEKSGGNDHRQKVYCKITLESGILLTVQKGDLTQFPADVVVNAANENLKHDGGLAGALSEAAGPELQRECDRIVQQQGKIHPGYAVVSGAGRLPYQQVIHAVGPRWRPEHAYRCKHLLKNAITECLYQADQSGHTSIAIPALSSGHFDFPLEECTKTIALAIKENFQNHQYKHSLKEIHLVDSSDKTVQAFYEAVKTIFEDAFPSNDLLPSTPPENQKTIMRKSTGHRNALASIETGDLSIILIKRDIQDAKSDIIVNTIATDLQLDKAPLSQAILKKAGPELQKELNLLGKETSVKPGHVLPTKGYNLDCKCILHVVASPWNHGVGNAKKIMKGSIKACLETADSLSLTSITFPAIGTGKLGFPKATFAKLILSQVLKFSSSRHSKTLKEVYFLLHPSDTDNIQAFKREFSCYTDGTTTSDRASSDTEEGLFDTIYDADLGIYKGKIGSITVQVALGDITKEESEVIVNSTNESFLLKNGVSKAILDAAGPAVESECAILAAKSHENYIITQGGNLGCKKIIHVIGACDVKRTITDVLQECEKMKYTSISLPAIGTGQAQQDPTKVAESIIDAIEKFTQKGFGQSVKKVKVVIFQPQLLKVFGDSLKKRISSIPPISIPPPTSVSQSTPRTYLSSMLHNLLKSLGLSSQSAKKQGHFLENIEKSATFQVCGKSKANVKDTISWIKNLILMEQNTYVSSDESILDFGENEYSEMNMLQKKLPIQIDIKSGGSQIEVSGPSKDVLKTSQKIEEMIKRIRTRKDEAYKAELLSQIIQWHYNDNGVFKPFDKITNRHLEDAKEEKKNSIDVEIEGEIYTVDFSTNQATNRKGHSLPVDRFKMSEVEIPPHWFNMKNQNLLLVDLKPGDPEFKKVNDEFFKTCTNFKIEKIQRIQNIKLWNYYKTRKILMDKQNVQKNNERCLFHGTDVDSLSHVNSQGFNRVYAGKNATAFGKGTYFAVNANYSSDDIYSKPDQNGKKYMYYVRVLTGEYTVGNPAYLVPPPKNAQNSDVLYDSVTDDKQNPSLFVIFYDNQSYPEYLITFRK